MIWISRLALLVAALGSTGVSAREYDATITSYGAGDTFGSPNCNRVGACPEGYNLPGFNAAASEALFKMGICGTCWLITAKGMRPTIVKVNNECPAHGNPLCSQKSLRDTNEHGANVNFDLCRDDGAADHFFGNSGVKLAKGKAKRVSCLLWHGSAPRKDPTSVSLAKWSSGKTLSRSMSGPTALEHGHGHHLHL